MTAPGGPEHGGVVVGRRVVEPVHLRPGPEAPAVKYWSNTGPMRVKNGGETRVKWFKYWANTGQIGPNTGRIMAEQETKLRSNSV